MPEFISVIKNDQPGQVLCYRVPREDFFYGSQLIVTEYEEALFMKDGIIEEVFGPGKYTLTTENFPILTKFATKLMSGGISPFNCRIYFINKSHHLELKWGTTVPVRVIDPVWGIEVHVQARGAYSVAVKDGKKFFTKLVGANSNMNEQDMVKSFRTAFVQNITEEIANHLQESDQEVLVVCNKKRSLAEQLSPILNNVLDEYGMELINFYIEYIEVPEDDECMNRIRELRIQRQEKQFGREQEAADVRLQYGLRRESADADRYVSGQMAQADYERMHIRDQDGNNGWARQEASEIIQTAAANTGTGSAFINAGMGFGMGRAMGNMMGGMFNDVAGGSGFSMNGPQGGQPSDKVICSSCNSVHPAGTKFCGVCGNAIEAAKNVCSACGAEIPANMKFCGQCGTPVQQQNRVCPNCGNEVPMGMKFCGQCGTQF